MIKLIEKYSSLDEDVQSSLVLSSFSGFHQLAIPENRREILRDRASRP